MNSAKRCLGGIKGIDFTMYLLPSSHRQRMGLVLPSFMRLINSMTLILGESNVMLIHALIN